MRTKAVQLFRSLLFVPGHRERMLQRAPTAGADVIVIDLEDAVPPDEKRTARALTKQAIGTLARAGQTVYVRVNGVHTGETRADLRAIVRRDLAGIVLPKTEEPQDIRDLEVLLREAEMKHRVRPGDIHIIPLIESTRGLLRVQEIAETSDRLVAMSIGGEDYTAELGVPRDDAGVALAHLRYVVIQAAVASGLVPIDTPYTDVRNEEQLRAETALARAMGFKGKYVIHPGQVPVVNELFTPSAEEVQQARSILSAAKRVGRRDRGVFAVNGRMVDAPVLERARKLIAVADAAAARAEVARKPS